MHLGFKIVIITNERITFIKVYDCIREYNLLMLQTGCKLVVIKNKGCRVTFIKV